MSKQVVKPDREPDFIDRHGGYYWFAERIHLSALTSKLYHLDEHPSMEIKEFKEAREREATEAFESVFLGKKDEQ